MLFSKSYDKVSVESGRGNRKLTRLQAFLPIVQKENPSPEDLGFIIIFPSTRIPSPEWCYEGRLHES